MAGDLSTAAPRPADLGALAAWAPELADTFVAMSCDVALVLDLSGVIVKLAQQGTPPVVPPQWLGQRWLDTLAPDSRPKGEQMLQELAASGVARRREINHLDAQGATLAVACSGVRLGADGPMLLGGQDLRRHSELQQRFLAVQHALERSYWQSQRRHRVDLPSAPRGGLMTERERASLGLRASGAGAGAAPRGVDDAELLHALEGLYLRMEDASLGGLLRDVRHAAERHFLLRAMRRPGGLELLARSLGMSPAALVRRTGLRQRPSARRPRNG